MRRQASFPPFSDTKVLIVLFKFSSEHAKLNKRPAKMADSRWCLWAASLQDRHSRLVDHVDGTVLFVL